MPKLYILGIAILWIFLVLVGFAGGWWWRGCEYQKQEIVGLWRISKSFGAHSDLQDAMILFSKENAYILMIKSNGQVIFNRCLEYELERENSGDGYIDFELEFDDAKGLPFPEETILRLHPNKGMMHILNEDCETIYLELFKDHAATAGVV